MKILLILFAALRISYSPQVELRLEAAKSGHVNILMQGYDLYGEPGEPALPSKPLLIAVPIGQEPVGVRITSAEYETVEGRYTVAPIQPPTILSGPPGTEIVPQEAEPNASIYSLDRPYPKNPIEFKGSGDLGGQTVAALVLHPIRYTPSEGKLEILRHVEFEVMTRPTGKTPLFRKTRFGANLFESYIKKVVLNPEDVSIPASKIDSGFEYLIISPPNFVSAFEPLKNFYEARGIRTEIRTTSWIYSNYSGRDNAERIRNYIKICAQDSGLVFVLLGGDVNYVPDRVAYAMTCEAGFASDEDSLHADLYFSDLDGNWDADGDGVFGEVEDSVDLFPDVFVGRVPASNSTDVQAFVQKVLTYSVPPVLCRDYQNRALFFAEILWEDPYTDASIGKEMIDSAYVPDSIAITKLYESRGNESPGAVLNAWALGQNLSNHDGHGWYSVMGAGAGYLDIDDIDGMNNGFRLPILYSIGCWVGAFDRDAISEHFIRNPNGGGVAFIGNSRYGWGSPGNPGYGYSDRLDFEFYGMVFQRNILEIGAALAMTKALFVPYSRDANVYRWHQYQVNLLGDPAMRIWRGRPTEITAAIPDTVFAGAQFEVVVEDPSDADGIVAISSLSGQLLARDEVVSGYGRIDVPSDVSGEVIVQVVVPDRLPFVDTITVVNAGVFITVEDWRIVDDAPFIDSLLNPNENATLAITLRNSGTEPSNPFWVALSSSDPCLSILTDSVEIEGLNPNSNVDVEFSISSSTCSPHLAMLDLRLGSRSVPIGLPIAAPEIAIRDIEIDDSSGGFEPGDTSHATVWLLNRGTAPAVDLDVEFWTDDSEISVDGSCHNDRLAVGEAMGCSLTVYVPETFQIGTTFPILMGYSSSISDTVEFTGFVGQPSYFDDFESGADGWDATGYWHLSTYRSHSDSTSWYCGYSTSHQYGYNWNFSLTSPQFVLSIDPSVSFYLWFNVAIYGSDGIYVEVIDNHGNVHTLDFIGSGGALDSILPFTTDWALYTYNLDFLDPGDTVRVRFRFVSDNEDLAEGFYIDDFAFTGHPISGIVGADEDENGIGKAKVFIMPMHGGFEMVFSRDALPNGGLVQVFDAIGRLKAVKRVPPNTERQRIARFDNLSTGVYFVKIGRLTQKVMVLR